MSVNEISMNDINNYIQRERAERISQFHSVAIVDFSEMTNDSLVAMMKIRKLVHSVPKYHLNLNTFKYFREALVNGEIDLCYLTYRQKMLFQIFINEQVNQKVVVQRLKAMEVELLDLQKNLSYIVKVLENQVIFNEKVTIVMRRIALRYMYVNRCVLHYRQYVKLFAV